MQHHVDKIHHMMDLVRLLDLSQAPLVDERIDRIQVNAYKANDLKVIKDEQRPWQRECRRLADPFQIIILMAHDRAWYELAESLTGFARQVLLRSYSSLVFNTSELDYTREVAREVLKIYYVHGPVLIDADGEDITNFCDCLWRYFEEFCCSGSKAARWKDRHYSGSMAVKQERLR